MAETRRLEDKFDINNDNNLDFWFEQLVRFNEVEKTEEKVSGEGVSRRLGHVKFWVSTRHV